MSCSKRRRKPFYRARIFKIRISQRLAQCHKHYQFLRARVCHTVEQSTIGHYLRTLNSLVWLFSHSLLTDGPRMRDFYHPQRDLRRAKKVVSSKGLVNMSASFSPRGSLRGRPGWPPRPKTCIQVVISKSWTLRPADRFRHFPFVRRSGWRIRSL